MGPRVMQLLTELEALERQIGEYTFPETDVERERLEAAKLLVESARALIVLSLDHLIAGDALPHAPETLGWLRVLSRWAGVGPPPSQEDIQAAVDVARRMG
jgi:hypothetical protein